MWDFYAPTGVPLERAQRFARRIGGAAANVALGLHAQGVDVALAGVVAADAFGIGLREQLAAKGLDVSAVVRAGERTGIVFIESGTGARPDFMRYLSFQPSRIDTAQTALPAAWCGRWLHIAALRPDRAELSAFGRAARIARSRGAQTLIDLNARPRAWRTLRTLPRELTTLLRRADVIKASHDDLEVLGLGSSRGAVDAARLRLAPRALWIVTRGARPTWLCAPWGWIACRPPEVAELTPVGAGDAFVVALLEHALATTMLADVHHAERSTWHKALSHANRCAASHVRSASS